MAEPETEASSLPIPDHVSPKLADLGPDADAELVRYLWRCLYNDYNLAKAQIRSLAPTRRKRGMKKSKNQQHSQQQGTAQANTSLPHDGDGDKKTNDGSASYAHSLSRSHPKFGLWALQNLPPKALILACSHTLPKSCSLSLADLAPRQRRLLAVVSRVMSYSPEVLAFVLPRPVLHSRSCLQSLLRMHRLRLHVSLADVVAKFKEVQKEWAAKKVEIFESDAFRLALQCFERDSWVGDRSSRPRLSTIPRSDRRLGGGAEPILSSIDAVDSDDETETDSHTSQDLQNMSAEEGEGLGQSQDDNMVAEDGRTTPTTRGNRRAGSLSGVRSASPELGMADGPMNETATPKHAQRGPEPPQAKVEPPHFGFLTSDTGPMLTPKPAVVDRAGDEREEDEEMKMAIRRLEFSGKDGRQRIQSVLGRTIDRLDENETETDDPNPNCVAATAARTLQALSQDGHELPGGLGPLGRQKRKREPDDTESEDEVSYSANAARHADPFEQRSPQKFARIHYGLPTRPIPGSNVVPAPMDEMEIQESPDKPIPRQLKHTWTPPSQASSPWNKTQLQKQTPPLVRRGSDESVEVIDARQMLMEINNQPARALSIKSDAIDPTPITNGHDKNGLPRASSHYTISDDDDDDDADDDDSSTDAVAQRHVQHRPERPMLVSSRRRRACVPLEDISKSLRTLQPGIYLNDIAVNVLISRAAAESPFEEVGSVDSLWPETWSKPWAAAHFEGKEMVLIPMNDSFSRHWLLYVWRRNGPNGGPCVEKYDSLSLGGLAADSMDDLIDEFVTFATGRSCEGGIAEVKCCEQPNGWDCGLYVIEFARYLTVRQRLPAKPFDSISLRRRIGHLLLTSEDCTLSAAEESEAVLETDRDQPARLLAAYARRFRLYRGLGWGSDGQPLAGLSGPGIDRSSLLGPVPDTSSPPSTSRMREPQVYTPKQTPRVAGTGVGRVLMSSPAISSPMLDRFQAINVLTAQCEEAALAAALSARAVDVLQSRHRELLVRAMGQAAVLNGLKEQEKLVRRFLRSREKTWNEVFDLMSGDDDNDDDDGGIENGSDKVEGEVDMTPSRLQPPQEITGSKSEIDGHDKRKKEAQTEVENDTAVTLFAPGMNRFQQTRASTASALAANLGALLHSLEQAMTGIAASAIAEIMDLEKALEQEGQEDLGAMTPAACVADAYAQAVAMLIVLRYAKRRHLEDAARAREVEGRLGGVTGTF